MRVPSRLRAEEAACSGKHEEGTQRTAHGTVPPLLEGREDRSWTRSRLCTARPNGSRPTLFQAATFARRRRLRSQSDPCNFHPSLFPSSSIAWAIPPVTIYLSRATALLGAS